MKRTLGAIGVAVTLILLAGCTGTGGSSSSVGLADGGVAKSQTQPQQANVGAASGTTASGQGTTLLAPRQVVTTGTLSLTVKNPITAATDATHAVVTAGGRVDDQTEQPATETRQASASLTLRVPAERLDGVVTALKALGSVDELTLTANDVTTSVKDVDARVTALQASVDRLLALMTKATDTKTLIDLESALSSRQADLDSLTAQQAYLKDQVAMSTLTLSLHSVGTVAAGAPDTFWGGLVAGWNALATAGAGFLVVLGVLLPWLVLIGLVGGVVLLVVRRVRRVRRGKGQPA